MQQDDDQQQYEQQSPCKRIKLEVDQVDTKTGIPNRTSQSFEEIEQMRKRCNQLYSSQLKSLQSLCHLFVKQSFAFSYLNSIRSNIENNEQQKNKIHKRKLLKYVDEQIHVFSFQWNPLHAIHLQDMFTNWHTVINRRSHEKQQERYFCVASIEAFWSYYAKLPCHLRHFYEIIPENKLCFMYFDIEVNRLVNSDWNNGDELITNLLHHLSEELKQYSFIVRDTTQSETQQINCEFTMKDVLDMDSSTSSKFSRHLLIRLYDANTKKLCVFENNVRLGAFIKQWISKLKSNDETNNLFFFQKDVDSDALICCIDEGVYTRNRAFRLFLSCKYHNYLGLQSAAEIDHKDIPILRLSNNNQFQTSGKKEDLARFYFENSLITHIGDLSADQMIVLTTPYTEPVFEQANRSPSSTTFCSPVKQSQRVKILSEIDLAKLQEFIQSLLPHGFIRSSKYFQDTESVIYYIGGNRYCENIQREHRSNHVYYVITLARGGGIYYQKCLDPVCKEYSSAERKIPVEYLPRNKDF